MFRPTYNGTMSNRIVRFDKKIIDQVKYYYETLPIVSSGIGFFLSHVLEGGIDIVGKTPSGVYEIDIENPIVRLYIKNELLPSIEKILLELILYGFSAIKIVESKQFPEWPAVVVIPHRFYTPTIVWDENFHRQYIAVDNFSHTNTGTQKIEGSHMLVLYEPFDEGRISSPLSLCVENMAVLSKLTEYYMRAAYFNSRPPFVFSKHEASTAGLNRGGPESARSSAALVGGASVAYLGIARAQQNLNDAEQTERVKELEVAQREMEKKNEEFREKKKKESSSTHIPSAPPFIASIESEMPITHSFTAPSGQKLERATPFETPTDLINLRNSIQSEIYRAIGIPPVMIKDAPDHASSVAFALTQMRQSIQHFQSKCNRILQTCLHALLAADLSEMSISDTQTFRSDSIPISSSSPPASPKREDGEMKNNFLDTLYPSGVEFGKDLDYEGRIQQFITAEHSITVEVEFVYNPTMTFEMMLQYYQNGVIHFEAFQDLALATGGLPISAKNLDVVPPPLFGETPKSSSVEEKIVSDDIASEKKVEQTPKRNKTLRSKEDQDNDEKKSKPKKQRR